MPLCVLYTNISDWELPDDVHIRLSSLVADVLQKPEERMTVIIHGNIRMSRAGSAKPTACLQLWTRGNMTGQQAISRPIYEFLSKSLQLPYNRITVIFHDNTAGSAPLTTSAYSSLVQSTTSTSSRQPYNSSGYGTTSSSNGPILHRSSTLGGGY